MHHQGHQHKEASQAKCPIFQIHFLLSCIRLKCSSIEQGSSVDLIAQSLALHPVLSKISLLLLSCEIASYGAPPTSSVIRYSGPLFSSPTSYHSPLSQHRKIDATLFPLSKPRFPSYTHFLLVPTPKSFFLCTLRSQSVFSSQWEIGWWMLPELRAEQRHLRTRQGKRCCCRVVCSMAGTWAHPWFPF
jgi:hypothetical protein